MTPTNIQWADYVWNPVTGCSQISEGCTNCYAKRIAETRLAGRCGYPAMPDSFRATLHKEKLEHPHWPTRPAVVFVDSMGDLFHKDVPNDWIFDVYRAISWAEVSRPNLKYVILTKRPQRMYKFFRNRVCLPNLWLGVSIENQQHAQERILWLLKIFAAKRIVSVEPMLGPVILDDYWALPLQPGHIWRDCVCEEIDPSDRPCLVCAARRGIDWVICGAETGPNKRRMNLDWARSLRDECADAGVPFFFKQDSDGNESLDGVVEHGRPE